MDWRATNAVALRTGFDEQVTGVKFRVDLMKDGMAFVHVDVLESENRLIARLALRLIDDR